MNVAVLFLAYDSVAVNRFCAVMFPLLLGYAAFTYLFGQKIQHRLIVTDADAEKDVRLRPYSYIATAVPVLFLGAMTLYGILYASQFSVIGTTVLLGYAAIRLDGTYSVKIKYSKKKIIYQKWKKQTIIPMETISKMEWITQRGSTGYVLVIHYGAGSRIQLSSSDFVGLNRLHKTFHEYRQHI